MTKQQTVCRQVPAAPPPPPLPDLHRQLGPMFTFASGTRPPQYPGMQGLPQQQQQNTFNFEAAALLALEYRSLVEKTRQRQMAELQAALANGTISGWKVVRLSGCTPCGTLYLMRPHGCPCRINRHLVCNCSRELIG